MATFILKSLAIGYTMIAVASLFMGGGSVSFFVPIFYWPALLIVSGLVALVLKAIEEQKQKKR